jgi:hypothetical protein
MGQEEKKIHIENDISTSKFINALYRHPQAERPKPKTFISTNNFFFFFFFFYDEEPLQGRATLYTHLCQVNFRLM